jgi:hypothetical protein
MTTKIEFWKVLRPLRGQKNATKTKKNISGQNRLFSRTSYTLKFGSAGFLSRIEILQPIITPQPDRTFSDLARNIFR